MTVLNHITCSKCGEPATYSELREREDIGVGSLVDSCWLCKNEHRINAAPGLEDDALMWLAWNFEWARRECGNCGYGRIICTCYNRGWYPLDSFGYYDTFEKIISGISEEFDKLVRFELSYDKDGSPTCEIKWFVDGIGQQTTGPVPGKDYISALILAAMGALRENQRRNNCEWSPVSL